MDLLEVREGLGLVPWSIEVHAGQMGTLPRLLHAVDLGLTDEGWAIDENTVLEVDGGHITVRGLGQAYHVWRSTDDTLGVDIVLAGETESGNRSDQPP